MRLLIRWSADTTLGVRNTDTVRVFGQRTANALSAMSTICQLVLPATTPLVMLTVHSEWFALLVLMVLCSGFISGRRTDVVRVARALRHRLWHDSFADRI